MTGCMRTKLCTWEKTFGLFSKLSNSSFVALGNGRKTKTRTRQRVTYRDTRVTDELDRFLDRQTSSLLPWICSNVLFISSVVCLLMLRTTETIPSYWSACSIRLLTPTAVPFALVTIPHFSVTPFRYRLAWRIAEDLIFE